MIDNTTRKAETVHTEKSSAPANEEKPTNSTELKVSENSEQMVSYMHQKIDELIGKKEIYMSQNKIKFCVYCRNIEL